MEEIIDLLLHHSRNNVIKILSNEKKVKILNFIINNPYSSLNQVFNFVNSDFSHRETVYNYLQDLKDSGLIDVDKKNHEYDSYFSNITKISLILEKKENNEKLKEIV